MDIKKSCLAAFPETALEPAALVKYRCTLANFSVYVICMTPRTGSGYLADLLGRAGDLGKPGDSQARACFPGRGALRALRAAAEPAGDRLCR